MTARSPNHVFVYGTLMPGRLRWPVLAPFARGHRLAEATGRLFDSGNGWPVAVFGPRGMIPGVVVALDPSRVDEALVILDEVEDTATDTLRRIAITTAEGTPAWAYHHPGDVGGFTVIERWAEQADR